MATTNFLLPGFEPAFVEQKNAAALLKEEEQKQLVEAALRTPAADISKAAGEMERHSPLFFGLAELEQQTLFGSVAPVGSSARNIKAGDATAATAAPTWSLFAEQEAAGERSEKKAKQREAQAIIEARRDHLAELLVEKGFAPNAFVLELNRSISTGKLQLSYPWNLPTRLMRFPIETSRDQVWDGEAKRWIYYPRTIGIIHPLLSEHPLVKQIEETIERKLEVGGGANQYGVSSTGHGEWWHALDLLAKGMTRELLDTRRFTSDEGIACGLTYALHYGEGNKPYTSIKDARMLLETIGATEPATRDAFRTLCSQPSLSDKNWPVNFRCNREGKRDAKAQA